MSPELERQIENLFDQAAALPLEQRAQFLDAQCPDQQVRQRVQRLLMHDEVAGDVFLRGCNPIGLAGASMGADQPPRPQQIGRYRIINILGHGGMGTVYEAEQDRTQRRIALKVIRPGWMSRSMLRRLSR